MKHFWFEFKDGRERRRGCYIDVGGDLSGGGGGGTGGGSGSGGGTTGAPAAQPGGTGGSPSSGGGGGGTGTGTGGAPTTQGQGSGQGATIDWSTAPQHLRTAYEAAQAELQQWKGLGVDHNVASTYTQTVTQATNQAYEVGRQLGYEDADIQESLSRDFVGTVGFLRQRMAQANAARGQGQGQGQGNGTGQGNGQPPDIGRIVDERLSPIQQFIDLQMTDTANQAFRSEFERVAGDKTAGYGDAWKEMPQECRDILYDAMSEVFKYDTNAMKALKFAKDVRPVAKVFNEVRNRLDKAFNAYHQYQLKKGGVPNTGQGQGARGQGETVPGLTLDDLIEGNERAGKAFPRIFN